MSEIIWHEWRELRIQSIHWSPELQECENHEAWNSRSKNSGKNTLGKLATTCDHYHTQCGFQVKFKTLRCVQIYTAPFFETVWHKKLIPKANFQKRGINEILQAPTHVYSYLVETQFSAVSLFEQKVVSIRQSLSIFSCFRSHCRPYWLWSWLLTWNIRKRILCRFSARAVRYQLIKPCIVSLPISSVICPLIVSE